MEHERKWSFLGRLSVTIGLLIILFCIIIIEIVLFVSGPAIRYDDKIAAQKDVILKNYEDIEELDRHVFAYIIYGGHDKKNYYWFNENGELLAWREMTKLDSKKAQQEARRLHNMENTKVTIGYGYEKPVYIVENDTYELYLDIDTYETVYFRRKGMGTWDSGGTSTS